MSVAGGPARAGGVRVGVVDYGLGNIRSVVNALECFTTDVVVADREEALADCAKIVLPGVGHFDKGMQGLRARGLDVALDRRVREAGVPLLGICLGFQFLFQGSEEGGEPGLGWVAGRIVRFPRGVGLKVPHMGWTEVECRASSRLFAEVRPPAEFYFVHGYYAPLGPETEPHASGIAHYGAPFVAAIERDNLYATQFHPEKSQLAGMKLLQTFLAL